MSKPKKINIEGKFMDVVTIEEYLKHKDTYNPSMTAIEYQGEVLPIIGPTSTGVGIHLTKDAPVNFARRPDSNASNYEQYRASNIIDFGNITSMRELIETQDSIRKMENDMLSSPDNITHYKIDPKDDPEMVAMKTAVNNKNIDIDKYEQRLGPNFNNYKRLFNKHSISMKMVKILCNALDLRPTLTIEDAYSEAPNPMNSTITIQLTGGNTDEDDEA